MRFERIWDPEKAYPNVMNSLSAYCAFLPIYLLQPQDACVGLGTITFPTLKFKIVSCCLTLN